jgi:hypothetical protein
MKQFAWGMVLVAVLFPSLLVAQTDTVDVPDYFATVQEGTLNSAIQAKIDAGTLSNTVFRLKQYGYYVLSATIRVPAGQRLTLYSPDPGTTQETCPPMICWTPSSGVSTTFNFDCYGDIYMKNIWLLYATTNMEGLGTQVGSALTIDQDTTDNVNRGVFDNVIFDYAPIANGGGSVNVQAAHARLKFTNCYWRNNTDTHFRYYGRALSFPYNTQGWHIDSVAFENCTFANIGYVYMQEGAEYADWVKFNHCTFLNTVMYTLESGWWWWLSVTNCVFVNPYMFGYIPGADGSTPVGGTVNIDTIGTSNFNFLVPFNEPQRHILFTNNSYYHDQWLRDYYAGGNPYSDTAVAWKPQPQPIMSAKTLIFFNDKTTWPYISMKDNYDSTNPGFLVPPTNVTGIKSFLLRKWTDNSDTTWAYSPNDDITQKWPMGEVLRYTNSKLKTGAMGGFPVGDIYRWWNATTYYTPWKAQVATENQTIDNWLTNGVTAVEEGTTERPQEFELSQNYPNPFNPATQISYTIPQSGQVTLKVFNVLGMEVATLFSGVQDAGNHQATFDASRLASGVYFYRLDASNVSITKKMVFMK